MGRLLMAAGAVAFSAGAAFAGTTSEITERTASPAPVMLAQKSDGLTAEEGVPDARALSSEAVQGAGGNAPANPNWVVNCTNQTGGVMACSMTQTLIIRETGQRLLSLVVRKTPGDPNAAMMITMPHGLFLPAGVQIAIDDSAAVEHTIQTCDREGCYVGLPVTGDLLQALRDGERLTVTFQNMRKETLNVPATLADFEQSWSHMN